MKIVKPLFISVAFALLAMGNAHASKGFLANLLFSPEVAEVLDGFNEDFGHPAEKALEWFVPGANGAIEIIQDLDSLFDE